MNSEIYICNGFQCTIFTYGHCQILFRKAVCAKWEKSLKVQNHKIKSENLHSGHRSGFETLLQMKAQYS